MKLAHWNLVPERLKIALDVSDGEDLDRDLEGLIDDDVIEEEEEGDEMGNDSERGTDVGEGRKRDLSDEEDEDLSEDDYDLLEENLGIKVKRKVGSSVL